MLHVCCSARDRLPAHLNLAGNPEDRDARRMRADLRILNSDDGAEFEDASRQPHLEPTRLGDLDVDSIASDQEDATIPPLQSLCMSEPYQSPATSANLPRVSICRQIPFLDRGLVSAAPARHSDRDLAKQIHLQLHPRATGAAVRPLRCVPRELSIGRCAEPLAVPTKSSLRVSESFRARKGERPKVSRLPGGHSGPGVWDRSVSLGCG